MADDRWGEDRNRDRGDRYPPEQRRDWRADAPGQPQEQRLYGAGGYEQGRRYGGEIDHGQDRPGAWRAYEPGRESPDYNDRSGSIRGGADRGGGDRGSGHGEADYRRQAARDFAGWDAPFGGRPVDDRATRSRDEGRTFIDRAREEIGSLFGSGRRHEESHGYRGSGQGEFRGRGPRGYRRSDERIREDVNDRLTEDPWLDASDIEVDVSGGEVTINGRVRSRADKRHAEDIVERVSGVGHVQNNLRADDGQQRRETDEIPPLL